MNIGNLEVRAIFIDHLDGYFVRLDGEDIKFKKKSTLTMFITSTKSVSILGGIRNILDDPDDSIYMPLEDISGMELVISHCAYAIYEYQINIITRGKEIHIKARVSKDELETFYSAMKVTIEKNNGSKLLYS